ncbi:MAG TPA: zinc metalloprotease, partial [Chitinophagaceae bacterium]|nr:zinc metalloprotease [Chitinophagaceae bacterium]
MKAKLTLALITLVCGYQLAAQKNCSSFTYQQQQLEQQPSLREGLNNIETFTRNYIATHANEPNDGANARGGSVNVIRIPVVVHILYHQQNENISDAQVNKQIEILNECFRRLNADTSNTPTRFAGVAADCEIEFQLAVSDPRRRNTTGIIRKYTPISLWQADDKVKSNAEMGDDAWDTKSYLNIWVCNLDRVAGYSTMPGGPADKDGVVISFGAFGLGFIGGMDKGRTTVHEVGHWLNLKHLWGDEYCGDDGISDTPKQAGYNAGCPSGVQITCDNGAKGDMYMNYMDYTNDECMNLFTLGQKARMRSLF